MAENESYARPEPVVEVGQGEATPVRIGDGCPMVYLLGPCVIESEDSVLSHAEKIAKICASLGVPWIFKASYDKANRTSVDSYRGPGIGEGLRILQKVRQRLGVPVVTDVHSPEEAEIAADAVDLLQVPAMLCRQTDLLTACARTGRPVMVKKGRFMHPSDMGFLVEKVVRAGGRQVMLCERGSSFGYRELVVDFRSLPIMKATGVPVVFDATHSVQVMGGSAGKSGGDRSFVPLLARAAVAVGIDALFMEVHEDPSRALSDGSNMVSLDELGVLIARLSEQAQCSPKGGLLL